MDEMRMVREMYGEVPRAPHLETRVRAQLDELARPGRRSRRPWRLSIPMRLTTAGAGLALTAGVAAVALIAPMGGAGTISQERELVLAAAHQAETQPQGRYWYSHERHSFAAEARGATGGYVVEERGEFFQWTGRDDGDGQGFYGRDIAGEPQTPADVAAWREAGKPSSWQIKSSGLGRPVTTKTGSWQRDDGPGNGGAFHVPALGSFTLQQLREFPTDPKKLKELLCSSRSAKRFNTALNQTCDGDSLLLWAFGVMENTPVSPEVRAGLMRMLANDPEIEALGTATDPLGREGVGLRADFGRPSFSDNPDAVINRDVIFDAETGDVLALRDVMAKRDANSQEWKKPGRVLSYTAVVDSGWTNQRPQPPR